MLPDVKLEKRLTTAAPDASWLGVDGFLSHAGELVHVVQLPWGTGDFDLSWWRGDGSILMTTVLVLGALDHVLHEVLLDHSQLVDTVIYVIFNLSGDKDQRWIGVIAAGNGNFNLVIFLKLNLKS